MPPVSETPPPAPAVVDPLHSDPASAPPADPVSQPSPAPTAVSPAAAPASAGQPAASAAPDSFWKYLHVVAGIGYNFDGKIAPDAEPFNSAAPSHSGPSIFLQLSRRVFRDGPLSLRAGLNLEMSFLSAPPPADSGARALFLGVLGEVNYDFHPVGIGGNLSLGWLGFSGVVDIGTPFRADLGWVSDGGLSLGGNLYAHALNGKVRAGFSLKVSGGFKATAPGQPDLPVSSPTMLMFFVGGDLGDPVRKVVGVDSSPMPSATPGQ